jgi:hypothetical protein
MHYTHSISLVILVLGTILDDFGVDVVLGSVMLEAELDDVDENVRFLSIPLRTIINNSSKNFLDDASVKPVLSYRTSYSPIQLMTLTFSYSLSESDKHFWNSDSIR